MSGKNNPETQRAWRIANKERVKAQSREKYLRNREKVIERTKAYWKAHPDKQKETLKRFKQKDPEAYRKYQREWARNYRLKNLAKVRLAKIQSQNRRRAIKASASVDPSGVGAWMTQIKSLPFVRCHWCGTKIRGKQIHFDHVIALSRGGAHTIANLCASCQTCNSQKQARAIADWICRGQTFLPL